jgi:hypothetical protein
MLRQVREPFQRYRRFTLGLGLEPSRDGGVETGGADAKTIAICSKPDGPQRGNAPGLPLADGKYSNAERTNQ